MSADLIQLGRTPVAVVCAGAKSILDLGRTLEVLESHGVPVLGVGTDHLPAFFSPKSHFKVPLRVETPEEAAAAFYEHTEVPCAPRTRRARPSHAHPRHSWA